MSGIGTGPSPADSTIFDPEALTGTPADDALASVVVSPASLAADSSVAAATRASEATSAEAAVVAFAGDSALTFAAISFCGDDVDSFEEDPREDSLTTGLADPNFPLFEINASASVGTVAGGLAPC